jgi:hypothetical protein
MDWLDEGNRAEQKGGHLVWVLPWSW